MKAVAIAELILVAGISIASALMLIKLPSEVKDLSKLLSLSSADSISKDIANLLSTATISPNNITIMYKLPEENSYDISIKGNIVKVNSTIKKQEIKTENSSSKTIPNLYAELTNVRTIEIYKSVQKNQTFYGVVKHE